MGKLNIKISKDNPFLKEYLEPKPKKQEVIDDGIDRSKYRYNRPHPYIRSEKYGLSHTPKKWDDKGTPISTASSNSSLSRKKRRPRKAKLNKLDPLHFFVTPGDVYNGMKLQLNKESGNTPAGFLERLSTATTAPDSLPPGTALISYRPQTLTFRPPGTSSSDNQSRKSVTFDIDPAYPPNAEQLNRGINTAESNTPTLFGSTSSSAVSSLFETDFEEQNRLPLSYFYNQHKFYSTFRPKPLPSVSFYNDSPYYTNVVREARVDYCGYFNGDTRALAFGWCKNRATRKCLSCVKFQVKPHITHECLGGNEGGRYCNECYEKAHPSYRIPHNWIPITQDDDNARTEEEISDQRIAWKRLSVEGEAALVKTRETTKQLAEGAGSMKAEEQFYETAERLGHASKKVNEMHQQNLRDLQIRDNLEEIFKILKITDRTIHGKKVLLEIYHHTASILIQAVFKGWRVRRRIPPYLVQKYKALVPVGKYTPIYGRNKEGKSKVIKQTRTDGTILTAENSHVHGNWKNSNIDTIREQRILERAKNEGSQDETKTKKKRYRLQVSDI